jgi:hypothetical protein
LLFVLGCTACGHAAAQSVPKLSLPSGVKLLAQSHGTGSQSIGTLRFNGRAHFAAWCNGTVEMSIRLANKAGGSTTGLGCPTSTGPFREEDGGVNGRYRVSVRVAPNTTWELLVGTN